MCNLKKNKKIESKLHKLDQLNCIFNSLNKEIKAYDAFDVSNIYEDESYYEFPNIFEGEGDSPASFLSNNSSFTIKDEVEIGFLLIPS